MKQSETIEKIAPALLKAQNEVDAVVKNAKNPHFKSNYADVSAVIDAVKPALNKYGIVFMQHPIPSENGEARMTTRLLHESGEWIESTITVPTSKNDAQGYGSALTYARRYALSSIMGLPQEDDDGNAASQTPAGKSQSKTISAPKVYYDKLSPKMKEEVDSAAEHVEGVILNGGVQQAVDALQMFCDSFPDDDTIKPSVWSKLQSGTRTAITKHQDARK